MGLYKEEHHALIELFDRQQRIYPDACDEGVIITGLDDPSCKRVTEIISSFAKSNFNIHRHEIDVPSITHQVSVVINIPWEYADCPGFSECSEWSINWVHDRRRKLQFISLSVRNAQVMNNEIYNEGA